MAYARTHQDIWNTSSTKSFYNSPQHATFMESNGENIRLYELAGSAGPVFAPVSLPTVWTWWKNTKVPIPPKFGPRNSTYLGLLASDSGGLGDPATLIKSIAKIRSTLTPRFDFIQPVLLQSGLLSDPQNFCDAIAESGIAHKNTESRIVELQPTNNALPHPQQSIALEEIVDSECYSDLLATYDSRRRYDIRRAPRVGVDLSIDIVRSHEQAVSVYESILPLHQESWARTGLGAHTLNYWTGFARSIRDSGGNDLVVRATFEGQFVSVVVVHIRGCSAFYQMNSSNLQGQKVSANPYALHAAMVASAFCGAKYFELGRYSDTDSPKTRQINDYKTQFGGFIVPVPNFEMQVPQRGLM